MLKSIIFGIIGAAIGGFVVYAYCEQKYNEQIENIVEKEVASAKRKAKKMTDLAIKAAKEQIENDNVIIENRNKSALYSVKEAKVEPIFVISEEEFGWGEDYENITLTYYNNDVLTDDLDEPIENPDEFLGKDWKYNFNSNTDVCYVRNTIRKIDYEIVKDKNNYEPEE